MAKDTKQLASIGFDPGEVDHTSVVVFGVVIVGIIVAVFIGVTIFWDKFLIGRYKEVVEGSPNVQLQQLREREHKLLDGYSYVDKSTGQVRIPLDRAKALLLSEVAAGKPAYPTKDTPKTADPAAAAATPVATAAAATPAPAEAGKH
jgi:nitrogen fixation/metabolism regulation signal transduction histidine kinase